MILEANCSNIILFCYGTILMFECYVRGFGKCLIWLCVSYLRIFFVLCLIAVLMSSKQLVLDRIIRINCNSSESIVFEMPQKVRVFFCLVIGYCSYVLVYQ